MSFDYNYKFWVATQRDLDDILKRQEVYKALKPVGDAAVNHYLFAELYARYVELVNKLGYIYHHTFQVQKRDVVKDLLQAATQRLLELKDELKALELSEFIYIDKILVQRRITPDDITVWTPKYFPYWRPTNVHEMINGPRKILIEPQRDEMAGGEGAKVSGTGAASRGTIGQDVTIKVEKTKIRREIVTEVEVIDPVKKKFTEVVTLIQSHERARVGRKYLMNIRNDPQQYRPKMREDGSVIQYKFTHKPSQPMLIAVKRSRFDANYYVQRKDLRAFNYYVKPVFVAASQLFADELSDIAVSEEEEMSEEEYFITEAQSYKETDYSDVDSEIITGPTPEELLVQMHNDSAVKIQSYWRGYRDRKIYRVKMEKKMFIYGMAQEFKPKTDREKAYKERVMEAARHRLIKENYDEEFVQFCEDEKARILRVRGPWIMEDVSDNIRAWFQEFYKKLGNFHPYPQEAKGGTLLLVKGETMTLQEYDQVLKRGNLSKEEKKKIKDKQREMKKREKDKIKKAQREKAKMRAKLKAHGIIDFADNMELSKSVAMIENTISKYRKEWENIDEKLNKKHEPIKEWITSDYFAEVHQELQLIVDEFMRIEYELLRRAQATDLGKKYKPEKQKGKGKKGKKKKTPKDMTADRSIESLYYELQDTGIVKTYPKKTMDYFVGDRNQCAFDFLNIYMKDTPPFKGEIRDVLAEYILGMGPLSITKPKGILLVGPTHSGKQLLCDILATEIDAVVFDISPEITVQYQSKMKYFLHVLMKMAKILQPSILYIRNAHRVFWKKVPPECAHLNPKLLSSQFKKAILKTIKKDDKIFLLGTSDEPWAAKGTIKKTFQKIILVPKTEYSTSFILRRNVTLQTRNIPRDFNFSALALCTRDYATGDLVKNIEETLNLRRRMELEKTKLDPMEFIDNFLKDEDDLHFPPELKEWEKFVKWYMSVYKNAKKRIKMIQEKAELAAKLEKLNKKKKM